MRAQPTRSRDRQPGRADPSRGGAAGAGGDALRIVRATRDQLGVAWSTGAEPLSRQVVCWDDRGAAVARLELSGTHRRATFAGLARLQQPFTIAVSGLGRDGSVLWQGGLADLYLRAARALGEGAPTECERAGTEGRPAKEGGRRCRRSGEERCGARRDGQDEEAEAEEEDRAREVAAAGVDRAPRRTLLGLAPEEEGERGPPAGVSAGCGCRQLQSRPRRGVARGALPKHCPRAKLGRPARPSTSVCIQDVSRARANNRSRRISQGWIGPRRACEAAVSSGDRLRGEFVVVQQSAESVAAAEAIEL
jgi:hypothetical protein